ncbi:hypothetical protein ID866_6622 [Astraeus odoratus]|nr:hypothetical protein ID866_6622 [Astraeus odoratus]
MQAVVQPQLPPPILSQYHLPSLNSPRTNPSGMPTPPVVSRKRKRVHQYTVSYSEVQEVDNEGRLREVIVIDDTPPPPSTISPATTHTNAFSASYQPPMYSAPIRTRARAAAEAQALSASTSSAVPVAPAPKKRKRDQADEPRGTLAKKPATGLQQQAALPSTKSWASGSGPATADPSNGIVPCDDKEGHYIIVPDDIIHNRYRTVRLLGQGTFGKVVEAVDIQTHNRVAIKIIRAIPKYRDAINNDYRLTVVPVPGKRNPPPRTKRILQSTDIRLIDFGSATFEDEYHSTVVSTRHYRAPEIILGLGWSYPCDAYSLGCILVEFYTGVALYQTHDNLEHLAMMEMVMGKMPERFARAGARSKPEFFKEGARLDWPKPKASRQSKKDDVIQQTDHINRQFTDLVRRLLAFDPAQRITVREALTHPYFSLHIPEEL